jgi:hypothetical protein
MTGKPSAVWRRIVAIAVLTLFFLAPLQYTDPVRGIARPVGVAVASPAIAGSPAVFDVAAENRHPGTRRSRVPAHWSSTPALAGFLGQNASTPRRRTVDLYINSTLHSVRIRAFRVGYYHGAGQRLVWTSGAVRVRRQRPCALQRGTRMVSCPWAVTTTVNTGRWPEGLYYLILTARSGQAHMIPLVVESASVKGKAVLVVNDCTMEAYNRWGGYSLYTGPGNNYRTRSYKVSFDRPYSNPTEIDERDSPLIRAAESNRPPGLRLAYTTESQITTNPSMARGATAVIFSGHSEYWSPAMRHTIETARNRGTNVVFFGANNVYWRTRLEASRAGAGRVEVCYREARLDPARFSHPDAVTTQWRQGPRPDAESTLTGAVYGDLQATGTFTVTNPGFFAFTGTGAARGATYPGLIQGETDRIYPTAKYPLLRHPANLHVFAHSPESGRHTAHGWADSTFYTTSAGAGVLDMASMDWLLAQTESTVPARSRAFATRVTQNIIAAAATGPLGQHHS